MLKQSDKLAAVKLVPLRVLQPPVTGGHIIPAVVNTVELELFLPLKWACNKPLHELSFGLSGAQGCQVAAQDWLFLKESRLPASLTLLDRDEAVAEQWDEVWKSHLVGHTDLRVPWICLSSASFSSLSLSILCFFLESKPPPFFIRGKWQLCALCNGCKRRETINRGKGVKL